MDADATDDEVRVDLLKRLAEQAMIDRAFRDRARDDLAAALTAYGYELNKRELALVLRFRAALADAGIDLDLVDTITDERLARLLGG
jgi:hypothetical protein